MALKYRPEIDGLRALAVLAVLVYHLKIPLGGGTLLAGGFLGVDVFFVLSGYLITLILLKEIAAAGKVSLREFYWRRARRVLPPLLLVMLASLPAAWLILLPSEMETFVKSQIAALLFVANGFWFLEQGTYGAASALLQPFLHTWSLAVEEQFYILFPLALAFLAKRNRTAAGLAALLGIFFLLSVLSTAAMPRFSFYSPVSRAWELLAGALLALAASRRAGAAAGPLVYLPSLCMAVLLLCLARVNLAEVAHPGAVTVIPVLATCGLIHFANPRDPVTRLLSTRPMAGIGLISYALYLWHFPVFAFGRMLSLTPGPVDMAAWLALSFAAAAASYFLVERPLRFGVPRPAFLRICGLSTAAVAGFAAVMIATEGARGRLDGLIARYGPVEFDNDALREASWAELESAGPRRPFWEGHAHDRPSQAEAKALWFSQAPGTKVLVVGNSHGKDLFNALHLNRDLFPGVEFARFGLSAKLRPDQVAQLAGSPNFRAADVILYAPRHDLKDLHRVPGFLRKMQAAGKRAVLVSNTAEFASPSHLPLYDHLVRTEASLAPGQPLQVGRGHLDPRVEAVNDALKRIAARLGVPLLDRLALVCPAGQAGCDLATPDGAKALYDYGHWTVPGAAFFGRRMAHWLDGLS